MNFLGGAGLWSLDRKQSLAYFGDLNRAVRHNLKVTAVTPSNYKHYVDQRRESAAYSEFSKL